MNASAPSFSFSLISLPGLVRVASLAFNSRRFTMTIALPLGRKYLPFSSFITATGCRMSPEASPWPHPLSLEL